MEMKIFNRESILYLGFVLFVDACILGSFFIYILGFSSKDGFFLFLQRPASVGDVIVVVLAALFILDDLGVNRAEVMDSNSEIRFKSLEKKITDKLNHIN